MTARKRILFITPPYHCGVVEAAGTWLPLTFVYLAGSAREAGLDAEIYDAMSKRHNFRMIAEHIRRSRPDFVATTAITSTIMDALKILRLAKLINPEIKTIIGGVHPTYCYEEILRSSWDVVDYVCVGEGEAVLRELLLSLNKGTCPDDVRGVAFKRDGQIFFTGRRNFIEDLDALSMAWDLVEWKDYTFFVIPKSRLGAISTSRGCDHDCTFCSQQKFWNRSWRPRRPQRVVEELELLSTRYGVNIVLVTDEFPTRDRDRWEEILDRLIQKRLDMLILMETRVEDIIRDRDILWKYRRAGIIHIYIGVEATNQETLDLIKKDIKVEQGFEAIRLIQDHGMITETSFVLGFPHETKSSIRRTLKLARHYNPDFAHFLAITPWPYADMYREVKDYIKVFDYSKYNLVEPIIKPEKMSLEEVDQAIVECYKKFYMGKLGEIVRMKDEFKRKYLLTSMRLIMNTSFLKKKMGSLGSIPLKVERYLKGLNVI